MKMGSPDNPQDSCQLNKTWNSFVVVLCLVLLSLLLVWAMEKWVAPEGAESAASEATAALGGALLAVGGMHHGHKAGQDRKLKARDPNAPVRRPAEGLGFIALTVAVWVGAVFFARWAEVSEAAVAGLAGGIIGITGVDAVYDIWERPRSSLWLGRVLIILGIAGGLIWIWKDPDDAEAHAAVLAAVITVGGAQLGHAQSFRSQADGSIAS
jgi:hypothetical protein